jgi:hypothetical protein
VTPRNRRIAEALVVAAALLFVGRWTTEFIAERWWAASVAPGGAAFLTIYALLGLALDAAAIVTASAWFALHALLVARAIASVQVLRRVGDLQLREAVPTRLLLWGAVISGVLLGLVAGAGAHEWRDPVMLAWQGVHYGVADPLLHEDIGVLVAQLPVWDLLHSFAVLLVLLGSAFCLTLYGGIGAIRFERRRVSIHADARRHLGILLACAAATITLGYLLAPHHLAASQMLDMPASAASFRARADNLMAGISLVAVAGSLLWALRGSDSTLVAGWLVLGLAVVGEHIAVPAMTEDIRPVSTRLATIHQLDALAWGLHDLPLINAPDSVPPVTALWDEPLLAQLMARTGGLLVGATPTAVIADGRATPAWLVATPAVADSLQLDLLAVADGVVGNGGGALFLAPSPLANGGRPLWRVLTDPRVRPDAPAWRSVSAGVNRSGILRRLLLAWARQAPGIFSDSPGRAVDWHLDPLDRADALLPMFTWVHSDLAIIDGAPRWLVQGMLPIDQFPLTPRARWNGSQIAGLVPAVIAVIDVATGATRFHLDPGADSLAKAWARAIGPLVEPATTLSPAERSALTYPAEWLAAQATVLRTPAWSGGHDIPARDGDAAAAPVWVNALLPGSQIVLGDPTAAAPTTIATGFRSGGYPQLRLDRQEAGATLGSDIRQVWAHLPAATHVRDSVIAAGDSVAYRATRWYVGHDALAGWQPIFALPRHSAPVLLQVETVVGDVTGTGDTPVDAWRAASQPGPGSGARGPDAGTVINEARQWVERADSALRRGDLTAFGRAFEALRSTLQRTPR